MVKEIQLRIKLKEEKIEGFLKLKASRVLKIDRRDISTIKVLRKSIDARKSTIYFNYKIAVYIRENLPESYLYSFDYKDVSNAK
jgi:uncharacterized FAD-dependent dehydrogenase